MSILRNISLSALVLLTIAGALLEGLVETVPPQFIQVNGILVISCTVVFVRWTLRFRFVGRRR